MKLSMLLGMAAASTIGIGALVGGGTYAYFSSAQSSNNNTFQTGQLKLTNFRNDLPISGPMFYTTGTGGQLGTGEWMPGDIHTRGMFVENDGQITATLNSLSATPEATVGSDAYNTDVEFAKESTVFITALEPVAGDGQFDSTTYADMLKQVNQFYHDEWNTYWGQQAADEGSLTLPQALVLAGKVADYIYDDTVNKIFTVTVDGRQIQGRVVQVYHCSLYDLMSGSSVNVTPALTIPPGETMYLGYTVNFLDLPTSQNDLQGLQGDNAIKFTFSSDYLAEHNTSAASDPAVSSGNTPPLE